MWETRYKKQTALGDLGEGALEMQQYRILNDFSTAALAAAVEANINAQLPLMYAHMPGVEVIDKPDLLDRCEVHMAV